MTSPVRFNRLGVALSVLALAAVFVATLTPVTGHVVTSSFWCVTCGELAGVDVLSNVVMFVPLGFALAFATGWRWRSVAIGVCVTVFVESMQIRVVTGRDASLSDILANSLGGLIGVEMALRRATLLRPQGRAARRLLVAGAALFAGGTALTSVALRPSDAPRSLWVQWTPERDSYAPFTGQLLHFDLNGMDLPRRFYPPPSLGVDRVLRGNTWNATATVGTAGMAETRSVIARIAEEFTVIVSLEQQRRSFVCKAKTKSGEFRFQSPAVALRDVFVAGAEGSNGEVHVTCSRRDGVLTASAGGRSQDLRLSPSLGWRLIFPLNIALSSGFELASAAWLFLLALPSGYWAATASIASRRTGTSLARRGRLFAMAITGSAFVLGLTVAPLVAGTAPGSWWEWASAVAGACAGLGLAQLMTTRELRWLFPAASGDRWAPLPSRVPPQDATA